MCLHAGSERGPRSNPPPPPPHTVDRKPLWLTPPLPRCHADGLCQSPRTAASISSDSREGNALASPSKMRSERGAVGVPEAPPRAAAAAGRAAEPRSPDGVPPDTCPGLRCVHAQGMFPGGLCAGQGESPSCRVSALKPPDLHTRFHTRSSRRLVLLEARACEQTAARRQRQVTGRGCTDARVGRRGCSPEAEGQADDRHTHGPTRRPAAGVLAHPAAVR